MKFRLQVAAAYLFLFGVELKALGESAGLRLQMLLLRLPHTFSIRDVLILSSFEQTVAGAQHKSQREYKTSKELLCSAAQKP